MTTEPNGPRIFVIDPATRWGWARWQPGMNRPVSGVATASGRTFGAKARDFRDWYVQKLDSFDFTHVFCEDLYPKPPRGGKAIATTEATERWQKWQLGCVQEAALPTHVTLVMPGVWRMHFVGCTKAPAFIKGSEKRRQFMKKLVSDRCNHLGYSHGVHDESDALGLLDYARSILFPAHGVATTPLFGSSLPTSKPAPAHEAAAGFFSPERGQ